MPTIDVDGLAMYHEWQGEGPPLVLILGLGGDVSEFGDVIAGLAERHRVLAFDNRGAGRTDKPDAPYTMAMLADDTAGLLRALDVPRAHVVGFSLGGRIAMELAVRHPEIVDRLVLASTTARIVNTPRRWWTMNVRSRLVRPAERGDHPQPRYAFLRQRGASDHYDGRPLLPAIHAPTVIMHGRADRTVRYRMAEELRDGITGSTLVEFTGEHVFPQSAERPRFVAEVTGFLAG